jgi:hypothetical protein
MNDILKYRSDYLIPGVTATPGPGFHRVTLSWSRSQRKGTLHLDPNSCGLDKFGDPTMCTLMAAAPFDMRLTLLLEDAGRSLYAIEAHRTGPRGLQPYGGPPLRLVTLPDPENPGHLDARLLLLRGEQITRIIDLHPVSKVLPYEARRGLLVLSADRVGGFVPPGVFINHVALTRIYGDGKVVFIDPAIGSGEIREGHLSEGALCDLFALLEQQGFFGFQPSYSGPGADMPTWVLTAHRRGESEKRVACYGGELSAPPGFMECFQRLIYPQLQPTDVMRYVRQPITEAELTAGWYYGFEYQKKLNTPATWIWADAGRSSQWRRPST